VISKKKALPWSDRVQERLGDEKLEQFIQWFCCNERKCQAVVGGGDWFGF
jgi:hypothetical protein